MPMKMSMKMSTEKTTWTKEELLFAVTTLQNANEYINTSETDMVVKSRAISNNGVSRCYRRSWDIRPYKRSP
jgi:hypothetical protein